MKMDIIQPYRCVPSEPIHHEENSDNDAENNESDHDVDLAFSQKPKQIPGILIQHAAGPIRGQYHQELWCAGQSAYRIMIRAVVVGVGTRGCHA